MPMLRSHTYAVCLSLALSAACAEVRSPSPERDAATSDSGGPDGQTASYEHDAATGDSGAPYVVPAVRFDPPAGAYSELPAITLEASGRDVELRYTLDGSTPSYESTPYEQPIALTSTSLVRAALFRDGEPVLYSSASYIELAEDVRDFSSNLPLLIVQMLGVEVPRPSEDMHLSAMLQVRAPDDTGRTQLHGPAAQSDRIGIKRHGRRTRTQEKPSWNLELRTQYDDSDNEQASLLDLPPQSDWVLYAPFELDRAIVRNSLFYELSNKIGRYAARTRFVEMFLATQGQPVDRSKYIGVYVVIESVKRDRRRVAVQKLDNTQTELPAISGGYLMRADEPDPGEKRIAVANHPRDFVLRYPRQENVNAEQAAYIADYLNAVGRASGDTQRVDPMTGQALYDLIDRESFIDVHLLNLFAKNSDAWRLSAYYHKPRNQKLRAGPVWDCDRCMGSYDGRSIDPHGWIATGSTVDYFSYGFWGGMFSDPSFEEQYWARLDELLQGPLGTEPVLAIVDRFADQLEEAAARNAARYPTAAPRDGSFRAEVDDLRSWLRERISWMRANLGKR
jgi:hypothetical protein